MINNDICINKCDDNDSEYEDDYNDEKYIIKDGIMKLEMEITVYFENCQEIWDNNIQSFIECGDCVILDKLLDYDGSAKFYELMMNQPTYIKMSTTLDKLYERYNNIIIDEK